jgi:hypothetical protein
MCTGAGVSSPHLLHEQADSRDSLSGLLLAVGAGIAALIHGGRALRHGFLLAKNSNDRSRGGPDLISTPGMAKSRHLAALLGVTLAGMALAFTPSRVSMLGLPAMRHRGSLCTSLDRPCMHQGQRNARPSVTTFDMSASGSSRGDMQRRRDVPSRPLPVKLLQGGAGYVAKGLRTLVYAVVSRSSPLPPH